MIPRWLEQLDHALDYRELHEIYPLIKADVESTQNPDTLAEQLDDAVRHLLLERARDQQELAGAEAAYQEFKGQQTGMVGWIKRHLPFTEARRAELQHRGTVAEQSAEILADNLAIARLTMLKERLLPGANRKLGLPSLEWHQRLDHPQAAARLSDYGQTLRELSSELRQADEYLKEVDTAIDAFERADFPDPDDVRRRDADTAAARGEWKTLADERTTKKQLRKIHLRRAGEAVLAELIRDDAEFRQIDQRLRQLRELEPRLRECHGAVQELTTASQDLGKLLTERESLPNRLSELERHLSESRRELSLAQDAAHRAEQQLGEQRKTHDEARRESDRANDAFQMAERMYQAHYGGSVMAEAPDPSELSPIDVEYQRADAVRSAAEQRLRQFTEPFERARKDAEKSAATVQGWQQKQKELEQQHRSLNDRQRQLQSETSDLEQRLRRTFSTVRGACTSYIDRARVAELQTAWRPHDVPFAARSAVTDQGPNDRLLQMLLHPASDQRKPADESLQQLQKWVAADTQRQQGEVKQLTDRRLSAWQSRCAAVLGDDLAHEVAAEFEP